MLLTDLGAQTMLQALEATPPETRADAAHPLFMAAVESLIRWQAASRPGALPPYDAALLRRELELFPE